MNKVKVKEEIKMEKKFGIFNSVEELNRAAAGQLKEGDIEALKELAKENGIDADDVEDYVDGYTDELATLQMAVFGKIKIEEEDIKKNKSNIEQMAMNVISTILKTMCTEQSMAVEVMKKEDGIQNIYRAMRSKAEKHKQGNVGLSCGTDRQLQDIIRSYYTKSKEEFEKTLESLYD